MPILAILAFLFFLVVEIFFGVQITIAVINFIGKHEGGFFDTGNFWAWVVGFLIWVVVFAIIKAIMRIVNGLAALLLGVIGIPFGKGGRGYIGGVVVSKILIWIFWLIASIFLTGGLLAYFAAHPGLNGWFAAGGFWASVLTYLSIMGLVAPSSKSDD